MDIFTRKAFENLHFANVSMPHLGTEEHMEELGAL